MREILFRGKRIDNGEWVYGFYLREAGHFIKELPTSVSTKTHLVDLETVGQFTGLADKNGKKIFEGDICRNTKTSGVVSVKWHGTMAGFVWSKRKEKGHLFDFGELFRAHDKYEVVGNIHDNSELLNLED